MWPGPEVIKLFHAQHGHEIYIAHKHLKAEKYIFLALKLSEVVFILLINGKMPTHL